VALQRNIVKQDARMDAALERKRFVPEGCEGGQKLYM
jgi:hypothetical protein